jgi:hypothetical protein
MARAQGMDAFVRHVERSSILVRIFPMSEGMQHNFGSKNVVAQSIVSTTDAPLPLARFQAGELLDLVPCAAIVGIVAENRYQFFEGSD